MASDITIGRSRRKPTLTGRNPDENIPAEPVAQAPAGRLKPDVPTLFFYCCLFLGSGLFAGFKAAALTVLLLALGNSGLKNLAGKAGRKESVLTALAVRSLFTLGLFPFLWLGGRAIAGKRGLWLAGLLLVAGSLFSLRRKCVPRETRPRDYGEMVYVGVLVIVLTWLPLSKIGYPLDGKYAYRAYFSSDYLKHYSVVEALNQGAVPPENLYFQGEALHYYWLPYAWPAVLSRIAGSTAKALLAFSFTVNFLFLFMFLKLTSRLFPKRKEIPLISVWLVLAPSLEGFYFWAVRARFSLSEYFILGRDTNIDGLTRWLWNLPQIDTLLRALFYTPQHLLSLAFLVLFFYFYSAETERPLVLSLCLALSLADSFFVGGIVLLSWGLYWLGRGAARLVHGKESWLTLGTGLVRYFGFPVVVLGLSLALRMITFNRGGFFLKGLTPGQIFILLGLNTGFLFLGGAAGLVVSRFPGRPLYLIMFVVSLTLVLFVRLENFESDISLKAGLVMILVLALALGQLGEGRWSGKIFLLLAGLIVLPGWLTLVLDVRNSADVHNRRFTSYVSFDEMRMMEWIRENVPAGQTVQNYPPARTWNLSAIPAFSGHRMFVGDKMHGQIFQVRPEAYKERIEALGRALADLPSSRTDLVRRGIDYLLWGEDEIRHFKYVPDLPVARKIGRTVLFALLPAKVEKR
jgi:hypothetical protein